MCIMLSLQENLWEKNFLKAVRKGDLMEWVLIESNAKQTACHRSICCRVPIYVYHRAGDVMAARPQATPVRCAVQRTQCKPRNSGIDVLSASRYLCALVSSSTVVTRQTGGCLAHCHSRPVVQRPPHVSADNVTSAGTNSKCSSVSPASVNNCYRTRHWSRSADVIRRTRWWRTFRAVSIFVGSSSPINSRLRKK